MHVYRITNRVNTTPIIKITQGPSVPPIITGKSFDEGEGPWLSSSVP